MANNGRLFSMGVRRGPLSDEVRRKLEVGVVFWVTCAGLPTAVVNEVVMAILGVAVGVLVAVGVNVLVDLVVFTSSSGGGVLGEQSSSSCRLAERKGSYLSPRPLLKKDYIR